MPERFETHINIVSNGANAVDLLCAQTQLSKARIKQVMMSGAVWLTRGKRTQRLRRAKRPLQAADQLHLYYDAAVLTAEAPPPALVDDRAGYSVWDKPGGLLSQGSKWGDHCTVTRYAETHLQPERNAFVVHRLDRAASGLILVAHRKQTAAALAALFRERTINKLYRVHAEGALGTPGVTIEIATPLDGKAARSQVTVLSVDQAQRVSTLDVSIETGRKHQIRRHLAQLGHPVVGDRLYGALDQRVDLGLRAFVLSFVCPLSHERVEFKVDPDSHTSKLPTSD